MNSFKETEWHMSSFSGPQSSPGFTLWKQFMVWQRGANSLLKQFGLTQPQFAILAVIGWMTRDSPSVAQQDLVNFLEMDKMHVSQIAKRLEKSELIARLSDEADQRSKLIQLTQLGRKHLAHALPAVEQYDRAFFAAEVGADLGDPRGPTDVSERDD